MCSRISSWKLVLLSLLVLANFILVRSLEEKNDRDGESKVPDGRSPEETLNETSTEKESLSKTETTSAPSIAETYRKLTTVVALEKSSSNDTINFRPSVHLGEIQESRIRTSPFNKVQGIKFDNNFDFETYREKLKNSRLEILQAHPQTIVDETREENVHRGTPNNVPAIIQQQEIDGTRENVKFHEEIPGVQYENVYKDQQLPLEPVKQNVETQYGVVDQQIFPNVEKPVEETSIYARPVKFPNEPQNYDVQTTSSFNGLRSPYLGALYDYHNYQIPAHELEAAKKPDNNILYVQESSFTRTRKFPYSFYQTPAAYHEVQLIDEAHPVAVLPKKRISPWKKFLHLLTAILPFGLLLATLTPKVVNIDNTTQPNIVLSKWRVADLPLEHKQARIVEESRKVCDERSICELILSGSKAGSSLLQNVLWNFATRVSTKGMRENELREIFEAAKKQNCAKLAC